MSLCLLNHGHAIHSFERKLERDLGMFGLEFHKQLVILFNVDYVVFENNCEFDRLRVYEVKGSHLDVLSFDRVE